MIAHRGGCVRAPENTLEAMRLGIADGADAIEFDVRLSYDGEVVVIHDATVDRTTDKVGPVEQMTLAELKSLDAGFRFNTGARQSRDAITSRIPSFGEILRSFPEIPLLIEIKVQAAAIPTRRLIEKHGAEDRCLVDSFSSAALSAFRGSRIALGAGRSELIRMLTRSLSGGPSAVPDYVSALALPRSYYGVPLPVARFARIMRSARKPAHIWTVNRTDEARAMWNLGATGIITDDVPAILAARHGS